MKRPNSSNEMKKDFLNIAIIEPDHPIDILMIFSSLILTRYHGPFILYPLPIPLFPFCPITCYPTA
jgi:hypothetical protein